MAEDTTIGLKIVAETDSFEMAMKKTKENIKQLGANFKESVASLDRWSQSTDGLTKRIDGLNGEMNQYKAQMDATRKKIEELEALEGDHSKEIENKKKILQEANTKYQETKQSISYYTIELERLRQEEEEAESASGQLASSISEQRNKVDELSRAYKDAVLTYGENSSEARNLARQVKDSSDELNNLEQQSREAESALNRLSGSSEKSANSLSKIESVGKKAGKALKILGASIAGAIGSVIAFAEGTRELRTNMGKLDTAFTTNGHSAETAKKTYKELYGVLGDSDRATEASNLLANMTKNEKDLKKWTEISTGVFAKFGDSLPVESLAEASMETAKTGKITGSLADALNWAGLSEDEFQSSLDKCSSEQERQALITDTLTKKYTKAGKQYRETNKDVIASNEAQAELSDKMADVGATVEPLVTQIKLLGASLLEKIVPFVQEWMPKIQANLPLIASGIVLIAGSLAGLAVASLAIKTVTTAITVWKTVTKVMTLVQAGLNAVMAANSIGLVIAGIGLLVAAFVTLWKKSEAFRNFWIGLWETIKSACSKAWESITGFATKAWDKIKSVWNGTKSFFSKLVENIVSYFKSIPSRISNFFTTAWEKVKSAWSTVKTFFSDTITKIVDVFKSLPDKMATIGTDMIKGMWNGIKDMTKWITDKLKGFGDNVLGGIKKFFKIESPSKVMRDQVGKNIAKGVAVGIEKETKTVTTAMNNVGDKALASAKKITGKIQDQYDSIKDSQSSMKDRLSGTGDLYSIDEETGKVTLNNLKDETAQIKKFGKNLLDLKSKLPKGMMVELSGLDTEEGIKVTDAIKAMSKKELKTYVASYKAREQASSKYYSDEVKNVKNKFADKVSDVMKTLPTKLKAVGVNTMNGFGKGMKSTEKSMSKTITSISNSISKQFKKDLKIHSPSEDTAEDGQYLVEGLGEGIETAQDGFFAKLGDFTSSIVDFFKDGDILTGIKNIFIKLGDALGGEVKELLTKIAEALGFDMGEAVTEGIEESIEDSTEDIETAIVDTVSSPTLGQKIKAGLNKLSTYFKNWSDGIGSYISQIKGYFDTATGYVTSLADSIGSYFSQITDNAISSIESEVEALQEATEAEITAKENQTDSELENLAMKKELGILSEEEYAQKKLDLEQALADFTAQKNEEEAKSEKELLKKKDELARKQFESNKRSQIANVLISTATGIMQAFAQLGPIAGAVASALVAATSIAQIATINAQKYVPALAKGGIADGATLAMIGEAGKEAVIPLEKNTGWMDELAEKLSGIMQKDFLGNVQADTGSNILTSGVNSTVNNFTQIINAPKTPSRRELYRDTRNLLALKGV